MFKNRREMVAHWNAYAAKHLVGRTIKAASYMTDKDRPSDWGSSALVLELDNGTVIYPMADDEGNDPAALAGATAANEDLMFPIV